MYARSGRKKNIVASDNKKAHMEVPIEEHPIRSLLCVYENGKKSSFVTASYVTLLLAPLRAMADFLLWSALNIRDWQTHTVLPIYSTMMCT